MKFLDLVLYEKLLRPIPWIRPLIKMQLPNLEVEKKLEQLELSMPHHVFNVNLNNIAEDINIPETPTGVRVIELDKSKPIAIYDLSPDENNPEVFQVNTNSKYLDTIENGVEQLKRVETREDESSELRLLRFPALNLEALWLAGKNRENDKYFLVRHFESRDGVLSHKEMNALVQRLKASAEKQDDTMGA